MLFECHPCRLIFPSPSPPLPSPFFSLFPNSRANEPVRRLNIILRVNFTRETEIVTPTRNNCQLPDLFTNSKYGIKIQRLYFCTSLIHWLVYAKVIVHLSVGEKTSIFTSASVNNCSLARDSEPIRLLEIPTSPSLYMLII